MGLDVSGTPDCSPKDYSTANNYTEPLGFWDCVCNNQQSSNKELLALAESACTQVSPTFLSSTLFGLCVNLAAEEIQPTTTVGAPLGTPYPRGNLPPREFQDLHRSCGILNTGSKWSKFRILCLSFRVSRRSEDTQQ